MKTRSEIIREAERQRREIDQLFIDTEYWNDHVRKPDEERIDPDPFGELKRLRAAIDKMLAEDTGEGPLPTIDFQRSH